MKRKKRRITGMKIPAIKKVEKNCAKLRISPPLNLVVCKHLNFLCFNFQQ